MDEVDLGFQLADLLVDDKGAVAGVELVELVRVAQLSEPSEVVLDLPDRTAWVVAAGQDHLRSSHALGVSDGRALRVSLRDLLRRTAEEGSIEGAQRLR